MPTIDPSDRSITLIVKASELFNMPNTPTKKQMDDCSSLLEDGGLESRFGDSNKDFETIVFMNRQICWSIEAADPNGVDKGYSVGLVKVFHNPTTGNPNFFDNDPLLVNEKTGKVCGTIAKNSTLPEKDDSYTIQFSVGFSRTTPNGGMQSGITLFNLDPKLRISSKQK